MARPDVTDVPEMYRAFARRGCLTRGEEMLARSGTWRADEGNAATAAGERRDHESKPPDARLTLERITEPLRIHDAGDG
jgi:hypothetical protein